MISALVDSPQAAPRPVSSPASLGRRILERQSRDASYAVRLARTWREVQAAQQLRFQVFNLELGEGFDASYDTGRDEDAFDPVCDHLLVTHGGEIVGTYRLQTGWRAAQNLGYYSAGEFDFSAFESKREEIVELGRACVTAKHRNQAVLGLLWRGIVAYARERASRYLIGCGSLTSQNEAEGAALYQALMAKHAAPSEWITQPLPSCACSLTEVAPKPPRIPKLLAAYLSLGATICGAPAIDRDFKTIDFLTLLDLDSLSPETRAFLD